MVTFETPAIREAVAIADVDAGGPIWWAGGLDLRLSMARLATENPTQDVAVKRRIPVNSSRNMAIFVKVVQEDGEIAWSSPIYVG